MQIEAYTAADTFPLKVLLNDVIVDGRIKPYHIQLYPTNLCNLNCSFCSCANRNKKDVLSLNTIKTIFDKAVICGCKAVTISGGGEPLLHPNINEIIKYIGSLGISVGLVTNGLSFYNIDPFVLNTYVTWCRISHSDTRKWDSKYKRILVDIIMSCREVDWSFSYVVTADVSYEKIASVIQFANQYNFTHVRLVTDLLSIDSVDEMDCIKEYNIEYNIDDTRVIYQGRKEYTRGFRHCLISLLKPIVNADGKLYPCCGVQYALNPSPRDCTEVMCMGDAMDIDLLYARQLYFDGSICDRCYYGEYNTLLYKLTSDIDHKEFV